MMGYGFGGWAFVYMLIFWVIIIAAAVWLLSRIFPGGTRNVSSEGMGSRHVAPESPLEIAKRRYARGEITKAEYEELRRDLSD